MNFLEPVHYWKTGIVLYKEDNQVCLEYRPHSHIIIAQIWGPKAATYWRYIRESISVLLAGWYKRLTYQISIPCLCTACLGEKTNSNMGTASTLFQLSTTSHIRHSTGSVRLSSTPASHASSVSPSPSPSSPSPNNDELITLSSALKRNSSGSLATSNGSVESDSSDVLSSSNDDVAPVITVTSLPPQPGQPAHQPQQNIEESLSDTEDDGKDKKGKFQSLRKSFRGINRKSPDPRPRLDTNNAFFNGPSSSSQQLSKEDFAECHMFSYNQLESMVMASKTWVVCPKSQSTISLDSIVPELTMADLSKLQLKFEDLEITEKIAEGGFGAVFKAKLKTQSGKSNLVAVKQLIETAHEDAAAAYREFWREVFMSSKLAHRCIVSLVGFTVSPCSLCLEFMPHGNLYSYLRSQKGAAELSWHTKLRIAINVAEAMAFLHSQKPKICHRDLKSPNILMADKSDPEIVCKISDFGESRLVATSGQGRENLANPLWLAPEVMRGGEYTEKCDVYSFAIIMWELLTMEDPFDEFPVAKTGFMSMLEDAIIDGLRPTIPASCNSDYRGLIEAAWDDDPAKRPTFTNIHSTLLSIKASKFGAVRKLM